MALQWETCSSYSLENYCCVTSHFVVVLWFKSKRTFQESAIWLGQMFTSALFPFIQIGYREKLSYWGVSSILGYSIRFLHNLFQIRSSKLYIFQNFNTEIVLWQLIYSPMSLPVVFGFRHAKKQFCVPQSMSKPMQVDLVEKVTYLYLLLL